ncbi:hypothetical protein GJ633_09365 [Halorubrum sp. CBA1125]|uniref:hypothetical protein n=1 Tax=Halorubrum sp. CBA1125 TaxID=2668072 RepID=UPI0012E6F78E|nr:hypothetical protein [Halorubrum sp. CBA1125]MUW14848.1 hypothetical protein [Halorubrum sp. CBA1125]
MSSRRGFLAGVVGVASGSLLDAELSERDLDELHSELFANGNRACDISVFDSDGRGFIDLQAGPVTMQSGPSASARVLFYNWDHTIGLGVESEDDEAIASTAVGLSVAEAKEVRDRLDATIALVESETDQFERVDRGEDDAGI